ncbi:MAG: Hsp70 family protein [Hyphomonadaceae bacterium]|nr:Hsp70 family protein [Hyphomonadaceae bacterium]
MSDWTLCIDFGTAFSKAAVAPTGAWTHFDPATIRPLMLSAEGQNTFLLDSAIFVDEDRVLFGCAALNEADAQADAKRAALRSFKTLLSVSDLERALNTNAPATIDPHRIFQMRDLIVLYLAYLLATIDRALLADPVLAQGGVLRRRYAAPAWRSGDSAGMHNVVVRLFAEAEAFRASVGKRLLSPDGLSLRTISDALPKAMANAEALEMGLVFEATAAAAYTSAGLEGSGSHLIVVDMGAGTTDIAALARIGARTLELPEARVTLKQAGDFLDRVIANRVLESARWARRADERAELWSVLMRQMADIKEAIMADGRATLRNQGRSIALSLRDVEKDEDFREFQKSLQQAYDHALAIVRDDARARGRSEVQAIAVGGGASTPLIQDLIRRKMESTRPRVVPRPATPDWAHAREFRGNLAPVFPQLAIAIGGALAPDSMLAARGGITPPANDQSDIPVGRD